MKVSIPRLFFYLLFLLIISCGSSSSGGGGTGGGGSGGGGGGGGPISLNQLATNFAQYLADLNGDEVMIASVTVGGVATVDFLGFSWCQPTDPYAAPAVTATPPNNLYGCTNVVSATAVVPALTVDFNVTLPDVFYDAAVQAGADLYMESRTLDTTVTVAATFINNGDGTFSLDTTITPTVVTMPGTVSAHSNDLSTEALLGTLLQTDLDTIHNGVMQEIMVVELMSFASTAASFTIP